MTWYHRNPPRTLLERYGCTLDYWLQLVDLGAELVAAGHNINTTPLKAFHRQRSKALRSRGIGWELSLPEWWAVWKDSGHWHDRGLGRGYMMSRYGDVGPYAVGNVYIAPGVGNASAAKKKTDLPIGVAYAKGSGNRRYRAYCRIARKLIHLGTFATVDEARAAYLAAVEFDTALKAAPERRAA